MNTEQMIVKEMAEMCCDIKENPNCKECVVSPLCGTRMDCETLYKAGYRKASDVIDEFVERLKAKESPKLLTWEYGEGYSDCIKIAERIVAEMRQEVNNG